MACVKRERTGHCGHPQCSYPNESGYECVDIAFGISTGENLENRGFCEVGLNCVERCGFSYSEALQADARAAWEWRYPETVEGGR